MKALYNINDNLPKQIISWPAVNAVQSSESYSLKKYM